MASVPMMPRRHGENASGAALTRSLIKAKSRQPMIPIRRPANWYRWGEDEEPDGADAEAARFRSHRARRRCRRRSHRRSPGRGHRRIHRKVDPSTRYASLPSSTTASRSSMTQDEDVKALLANGVDTVRRLRRGLANALRSAEKTLVARRAGSGRLSREPSTGSHGPASLNVLAVGAGRSTAVGIASTLRQHDHGEMDVARASMRVCWRPCTT